MSGPFRAIKVTDKVYWVGAIDWGLRDFHGYSTGRGTTYNSYLILSERPVLIDTVKKEFAPEMLSRIASVIDPGKIKTIVSNHAEMDHSGSLGYFIDRIKPETILASAMGEKALAEHFHHGWKVTAVKEGESFDIGGDRLVFHESRMLHWPDSMVAWLEGEKVLFSNDIFGMHLASDRRFDDETEHWRHEAAKYYANIVLPYSDIVLAFAKKLLALNLPVKYIAPDHGPIWRKDIKTIIELYLKWASQKPERRAVVAFDSMWGSTKTLADAFAEGLTAGGVNTSVMSLKANHRSDVMTELMCAGGFFLGTPTMNKEMYPSVADLLTYVKGLAPKNLKGQVFGSYGWAPAGQNAANEMLKAMKVQVLGEPLACKYVPDAAALLKARQAGETAAVQILKDVCDA
ncbi:MAG TPA: FprA family A-type flavoprotein [Elusimicrobiales bacterium]|nr:FprA family A-type flavoprotein [Elusimicrobiales bacterium]